jgi:hypothetical protein
MNFYKPADVETKEIVDFLMSKLGIPLNVINFSVHFSMDDAIRVDCTYFPERFEEVPE